MMKESMELVMIVYVLCIQFSNINIYIKELNESVTERLQTKFSLWNCMYFEDDMSKASPKLVHLKSATI